MRLSITPADTTYLKILFEDTGWPAFYDQFKFTLFICYLMEDRSVSRKITKYTAFLLINRVKVTLEPGYKCKCC